jgi:TatD-related deoxyribonuclease
MEDYDGPIMDNHLHLDPGGEGPGALKDFSRMGGTHIFLVHKPYSTLRVRKADDFPAQYDITLDLASKVRDQTDLKVFVAAGPYPVEYIHLMEKLGPEKAEEAMLAGMRAAADLVAEGRVHAIGEIGRPHFPVEPEVVDASNRILKAGMEMAAEVGCPVVLHTETTTPEVCAELAAMADSAGLARDKVVKHFSPPLVDVELNAGLFPSVLASEKAVTEAARQGNRFLMETDFLDDPRRPGAVMGVKTVPKRTKMLLEKELLGVDDVWKIHKDHPEKVYGISME